MKRWMISLFGVTALALLIWFFGPLVSIANDYFWEPPLNRIITINLLYLIWIIAQVIGFYRARKRNQAVIQGMMESPPEEPAINPEDELIAEEEQLLRERFEKALQQLKQTKLGKGNYLYQLPWYAIIGPPGCGKTTLLANSGLKFPLEEEFGQQGIQGIGGTRNCDWWFAEQAILLDTAGRYTTQDSHETVDKQAWLNFLALLKKHRRRRPLNGALVAVSLSDLLNYNEVQLKAHAHAIRQRIQELYDQLGVRIPVYFMLTKCDLLAGFMEYFADLSKEEREQVWGMTFPLEEQQSAHQHFSAEFELLMQRLEEQLISKLQRESAQNKRNLIYVFPQQFYSFKQRLKEFIDEIFASSRYQEPVMLRGIYFTSATQEGNPIDRLLSSMAHHLGMSGQPLVHPVGQGRSYFIHRLLTEVIFKESGLAGTNLKLERRQAWIKRLAYAGLAGITVLALIAWFYSYVQNSYYLDEIQQKTAEIKAMAAQIPPDDEDVLKTLPLLDALRNLPGGYADQLAGRKPWSMRFGLYQGDKVGEAAVASYEDLLKKVFLARLMSRMENEIRHFGSDSDYLFESLKAYLMLGDAQHYDKETIMAWILFDWDRHLKSKISAEQYQALNQHLQALFKDRPLPLPKALDQNLIAQAQQILSETPLSKRIYARLKRDLLKQKQVPDFRISEAAGRDAPLVFVRKSGAPLTEGIPGLFTYDGYYQVFLPQSQSLTEEISRESWVLGPYYRQQSEADLQALHDEVLALYFKDYARYWLDLIEDIQIVPFANLAQAVEVLNILSAKDSPLKKLLQAVERETAIDRQPPQAEEGKNQIKQASSALAKARSKLSRVVNTLGVPVSTSVHLPAGAVNIIGRFRRLQALVRSEDENSPPPIDRLLALLNELYVYLNALLQASGEELVLEQRKQIAQVVQKVKTEAKRQPDLVNEVLNTVADSSASLVGGGVCQHLNAAWKEEVYQFCKTAIAGRYPIDRQSRLEITQEDFGLFFGPRGKMESYFNKYLAPFVDRSRSRWRWIKKEGEPVCASSQSLLQFQYAKQIKESFFRSGTAVPSFGFSLKPISMDSRITQMTLDIDGQVLTYAHGPVQSVSMRWPGNQQNNYVRLQLTPPMGLSGYSFDGPWALFRLLDQAEIHRLGRSEQFILTFNIGGRELKLELRAATAINPFNLQAMQAFQCRANL